MINSFSGEYRFLSNFWKATVTLDGVVYPSVEHAYQAAKTLDAEVRKKILAIDKPGEVKKFARTIEIREDWEEVKVHIMFDLVTQKFFNHPHLAGMLLDTEGMKIVEGNTWGDTFWGECNGVGKNMMGKIAMLVRKNLRESGQFDDIA